MCHDLYGVFAAFLRVVMICTGYISGLLGAAGAIPSVRRLPRIFYDIAGARLLFPVKNMTLSKGVHLL
jgi:hypothetical protein